MSLELWLTWSPSSSIPASAAAVNISLKWGTGDVNSVKLICVLLEKLPQCCIGDSYDILEPSYQHDWKLNFCSHYPKHLTSTTQRLLHLWLLQVTPVVKPVADVLNVSTGNHMEFGIKTKPHSWSSKGYKKKGYNFCQLFPPNLGTVPATHQFDRKH